MTSSALSVIYGELKNRATNPWRPQQQQQEQQQQLPRRPPPHQYQYHQHQQQAAAVAVPAAASQHKQQQQHDARYYASCYLAGGLSSGIRWVLSPLELVKTRLQTTATATAAVSSVAVSGGGIMTATALPAATMAGTFRSIYVHEGGVAGLFRGLGPTAVAYWFQTSTKYGLYEILKDQFLLASPSGSTVDQNEQFYRGLSYVAAAATAEAVADVLMCPWEMVKVKLQTTNIHHHGNTTNNSFPSRFGPALVEMARHRRQHNFPFGSLGPLWGRQIPGTVVNFYAFESAAAAIYRYVAAGNGNKSDCTAAQQLGVTFCAGNIAGVCSAVISHPADSLISLKALPEHAGRSAWHIVRTVGITRLATRGLAPRILVTGQIISVQWLLYDTCKSLCGYGTSGGDDSSGGGE